MIKPGNIDTNLRTDSLARNRVENTVEHNKMEAFSGKDAI